MTFTFKREAKMSKKSKPKSIEVSDLRTKRSDLSVLIAQALQNPSQFMNRKETIKDKLNVFRTELENLKTEIVNKRITFKIIQKILDELGLKVTDSSLRNYFKNELDYVPAQRASKKGSPVVVQPFKQNVSNTDTDSQSKLEQPDQVLVNKSLTNTLTNNDDFK